MADCTIVEDIKEFDKDETVVHQNLENQQALVARKLKAKAKANRMKKIESEKRCFKKN